MYVCRVDFQLLEMALNAHQTILNWWLTNASFTPHYFSKCYLTMYQNLSMGLDLCNQTLFLCGWGLVTKLVICTQRLLSASSWIWPSNYSHLALHEGQELYILFRTSKDAAIVQDSVLFLDSIWSQKCSTVFFVRVCVSMFITFVILS